MRQRAQRCEQYHQQHRQLLRQEQQQRFSGCVSIYPNSHSGVNSSGSSCSGGRNIPVSLRSHSALNPSDMHLPVCSHHGVAAPAPSHLPSYPVSGCPMRLSQPAHANHLVPATCNPTACAPDAALPDLPPLESPFPGGHLTLLKDSLTQPASCTLTPAPLPPLPCLCQRLSCTQSTTLPCSSPAPTQLHAILCQCYCCRCPFCCTRFISLPSSSSAPTQLHAVAYPCHCRVCPSK